MRKTFMTTVILFVFSPILLFSQQSSPFAPTSSIDSRLVEAFGKDYMDKIAKEDPFLLNRWTYYLDHAFFIADSPLSKDESADAADYPSVKIANLAQVNIFKLEQEQGMKREYLTESIYKIAGTKKYLVYYAGRDFIEKFSQFWEEKKKENSK